MLPAAHRLRTSEDFRRVRRLGKRVNTNYFGVNVYLPGSHTSSPDPITGSQSRHETQTGSAPIRVGFVVSKKVGNAVTRNRVARRLRHQMRPYLSLLPASSEVVITAYPAAREATSAQLGQALHQALRKAVPTATSPDLWPASATTDITGR